MAWTVEFFSVSVKADLYALPTDMVARFLRICELIEISGLQSVHEPYVKHLSGPLWEMRMRGRDGIARAAYITAQEQRIVVVHVFRKKTRKTAGRDLDLALKRAKEIE